MPGTAMMFCKEEETCGGIKMPKHTKSKYKMENQTQNEQNGQNEEQNRDTKTSGRKPSGAAAAVLVLVEVSKQTPHTCAVAQALRRCASPLA